MILILSKRTIIHQTITRAHVLSNHFFNISRPYAHYYARISVHFHKYSNTSFHGAKDYPLITPVPTNLLQFWKKKSTPNYNVIQHPEAGIIFHLSPDPPYSPLLLFPPPSRNCPSFRDGSIAGLTISRHGKRSARQPRRSLTPVRRPADGQFTFRQRRLSSGRCERKLDGPPCRVPHFSLFFFGDHLPSYVQLRSRSHRGFEKCRAITERSSLACYEVWGTIDYKGVR